MSVEQEEPSGDSANIPSPSANPALERLLGHVPTLSAQARGGLPVHRWLLFFIMLVGALVFLVGIDWGLPSKTHDRILFGGDEPWSGETIGAAVNAETRWAASQPSNIDVDETEEIPGQTWTSLTETDRDRAEILLRYRLYTHQPDEMTILQALRSMDPTSRDFDPKMYQYGGLFLYPIAGLLWVCGKLNLMTLTSQVSHYLDRPEDMVCFYLVARGYVVLFGLLGILAAYRIGCALRDRTAGLVAALLFVLMPITVNMSHEAKPHLPAAVLTMWAVYLAMRYMQSPAGGKFAGMSALCGTAVGMVPASWCALVLIPIASFAKKPSAGRMIGRLVGGALLALLVYLACNPYVGINAVRNPDLLRDNFLNTSGMYAFGSLLGGAKNVARLTLEGTGPLCAVAAILPLLSLGHRRTSGRLFVLAAPALLVGAGMVAFGDGKPGEYGRFGVFLDIALMSAVAAEIARIMRRNRTAGILAVVIFAGSTGLFGQRYLRQFLADSSQDNTRIQAATWLQETLADRPDATIGVIQMPAPYAVPPLDFAHRNVLLLSDDVDFRDVQDGPDWVVFSVDRPSHEGRRLGPYVLRKVFRAPPDPIGSYNTVISWANKPICIWEKVTDRGEDPGASPSPSS